MADWFTGPSLAIGIAVVVVIGGLVVWGVRELERRSRRDEDAARLQAALSEPLAREAALAGSGVKPVVWLPWRGRARVELTGWVPSPEIRDVAVRAIAREAARLGRPVRVVDHVEILHGEVRRGA
ncbi:MAG TPA: hypothetical protein VFL90_08935 [Methylomirabilota bacterium]|nr:hypothetical protein [Methylomirabilota bacterium]